MKEHDPSIALFLCSCGHTINKIIDFQTIRKFIETSYPNIQVYEHDKLCLAPGLQFIKNATQDKKIHRLVIAACTPQNAERIFDQLKLKYPPIIANIREQGSWVIKDTKSATKHVEVDIAMAVTQAQNQKPSTSISYSCSQHIMVIGGGFAGLSVSDYAARLGLQVTLIEERDQLGGLCTYLTSPYYQDKEFTNDYKSLIKRVNANGKITVALNSQIEEIHGEPGAYLVQVRDSKSKKTTQIKTGSLVVATGNREFTPGPKNEYRYGTDKDVLTQNELEWLLNPKGSTEGIVKVPSSKKTPQRVHMIQCVGSRTSENPRCSTVCCNVAVKNALQLIDKGVEVSISYKDIRTPWFNEELYRLARNKGVTFIRGDAIKVVRNKQTKHLVTTVENTLEDQILNLESDLVILSGALLPSKSTPRLIEQLGLKPNRYGYPDVLYSKLKAHESNQTGIWLCGGIVGPQNLSDIKEQSAMVALETYQFLNSDKIQKIDLTPEIDEDLCVYCQACALICPNNAIDVTKDPDSIKLKKFLCKACGQCTASCPTGAIQLKNQERDRILQQLDVMAKVHKKIYKKSPPYGISFLCKECSYASADLVGPAGGTLPSNLYTIRLPCAGRVSILQLLYAFWKGAWKVMVAACPDQSCHHISGSRTAQSVVEVTRIIMKQIGLDPNRLEFNTMLYSEPQKYQEAAKSIITRTGSIGNTTTGGQMS